MKHHQQENKKIPSSKIPSMFIELHDFMFRHGTNQIRNFKFIGRTQIKNRLKTILSYGNNNSGAYLITGNRGVGKTTLVNQVLEEKSPEKLLGPTILKFIKILAGILLFDLIVNTLLSTNYLEFVRLEQINWITIPIFLLCSVYTVYLSRRRKHFPSIVSWHDIYNLYHQQKNIVGKTTLVNQVLEEISPEKLLGPTILKFIKILAGILLFDLIVKTLLSTNYLKFIKLVQINWITIPIFLLCSVYTVYLSRCSPSIVSLHDIYNSYHQQKFIHTIFLYLKKLFFSILRFLNYWVREFFTSNFTPTTPSRHFNTIKYIGTIFAIEILAILINCSPIKLSLYYGILLWWGARTKKINRQLCNPMKTVHKEYKEMLEKVCNKINTKKAADSPKFLNKINLSYIISGSLCLVPNFFTPLLIALYTIIFSLDVPLLLKHLFYFNICISGIYFIIATSTYIFISKQFRKRKKTGNIQETRITWQLLCKAYTILKDEKKHSRFFKKLLNSHQQLFVKINLGYNELNTVDVLRLISHNITIEYRKYIYSGTFLWTKYSIIFIICYIISHYMYSFNDWLQIHTVGCPSWIEHLYEKAQLILNFFIASFCQTLSLNPYKNLDINAVTQLKYLNIPFLQFLIFIFLLFTYRICIHALVLLDTPHQNLKRLEELQDSIAASIKREEGMASKSTFGKIHVGISKKTEKNYPMSDAHDIEKKLIDILSQISKGWLLRKPQIIIIFDELDKLEDASDKQENIIKTDSFSPDTVRRRQEAIYKLLSGLKYLLTTMQAKFIFVAGRELYEASLADASDRNHYLSSIFNDVIIVPSFMADDSDQKGHDIFSMTEQYVCRHLIPTEQWQSDYSLEKYKQYMEAYDKRFFTETGELKKRESERQRILLTLHNFIIYLTYASKGAPKKMISLFEKHVERLAPTAYERTIDEYEQQTESPIRVKFYANSNYYLRFDFYDQYIFSLMKRIVCPMTYRFSRTKTHKFGDKALVSSLFFLDHLYKFHRNSFSWRALECTPELIDINKIPELRDHVTDILHFMSQNDLKNISNGLYDFRFFKKISQEVCFVTRVSEQAAAIFNFTLDESYSVKQYYQRKLIRMREQYSADQIKAENTIEELTNLHFTLGELHLYDEEIGEAIIEFDAAISILYTIVPQEMSSEQIVILMKSMLSLGIAYEKQNQNDRALLIYIEAVRLLIASKNTDISEFGLQAEEENKAKKMVVKTSAHYHCCPKEPYLYFKEINGKRKDSLINILDGTPHLHPAIQGFLSKITAFESLKILYLPILAKIQILEKSQDCGIQPTDIKRAIKEFYYLANMMNKENKYIFCANFYLKIGDILFYKNSSHIPSLQDFYSLFPFPELLPSLPCEQRTLRTEGKEASAHAHFFKQCQGCNICSRYCQKCLLSEQGYGKKSDALFFYMHSLRLLLKDATDSTAPMQADEAADNHHCLTFDRLMEILQNLHEKSYKGWDESRFHLLATVLTNIGDVLFSISKDNRPDSNDYIKFLNSYIERRKSGKDILESLNESKAHVKNGLSRITLFYLLAYLYFKKATSYNMASFQCQRILSLIKYNVFEEENKSKEICEKVARHFLDTGRQQR